MTVKIETGSYTGTGNDDEQIDLAAGFGTPDFVLILADATTDATLKTSAMSGNNSVTLVDGSAQFTDRIKALGDEYFTLGTNADVNNSGSDYYYLAIQDANNDFMKVGTVTGNSSSQSVDIGTDWQPNQWWYKGATAVNAYLEDSAWGESNHCVSLNDDNDHTNKFGGFDADGFDLQNHSQVNNSGDTYYYVCFKHETGFFSNGTYTGNAPSTQNVTSGDFSGEQIPIAIRHPYASRSTHISLDSMPEGESFQFFVSGMRSDVIIDLLSGGFQVDGNNEANENGTTFHYTLMLTEYPAAGGSTLEVTMDGGAVVGGAGTVEWIQSLPVAGAGGAVAGGTAAIVKEQIITPAAGAVLGGAAAVEWIQSLPVEMAGGAVFGGTAPIDTSSSLQITMDGGLVLGDSAGVVQEKVTPMVGGAVVGGAAAVEWIQSLPLDMAGGAVLGGEAAVILDYGYQSFITTMAGGVVAGGAGALTIEQLIAAAGGVVLGGAAEVLTTGGLGGAAIARPLERGRLLEEDTEILMLLPYFLQAVEGDYLNA